jgi:hypothetical protein
MQEVNPRRVNVQCVQMFKPSLYTALDWSWPHQHPGPRSDKQMQSTVLVTWPSPVGCSEPSSPQWPRGRRPQGEHPVLADS